MPRGCVETCPYGGAKMWCRGRSGALGAKRRADATVTDTYSAPKMRCDLPLPGFTGCQRLIQVRDNVLGGLDADLKPHQPVADADPLALLRRDGAVR